jgi:HEAT repeat protein
MAIEFGARALARVMRRCAIGAFVATVLVTAFPRTAPALDAATARRELQSADDFRVRATAAYYLGKSKAHGAREALERALSDAHPAVSTAAAAALGSLADPAAIPALQRALGKESSDSVKAQIRSTIEVLKHDVQSARLVVRMGNMRNGTDVRGEQLGAVLARAFRTRAATLQGIVFAEDEATARAAGASVPVLTFDGSVTGLTQGRDAGNVTFRAVVEFSVRKDQTLRATLRGAATAYDSMQVLSNRARVVELQNDAVDGAVQSALRNVDTGLAIAAK